MSNLKTNYKDAELSPSMNGKRQYELQYNEAGYTNLVDKTAYTEVGDTFGADDINATNSAVNELNQNLTDLMEGGVYEFSANGQNQTFTVNFQKTHKVAPSCVQLTVQRLSTSNVLTCTCELESMGNESFTIHVKGSNGLGYRINWLAYFG